MTPFAPSGPLTLISPQVPPLDNTLGAILIGTFVGLVLYGLVVHQCYRYFRLYPKDSGWTKALVLSILALESFHVVLGMHICYHYLISSYADPYALLSGVWSVSLLSVTCGLIIISTQRMGVRLPPSFFARRIYLLGGIKYRVLVAFLFILFAVEFGFSCAATAKAFSTESFFRFEVDTWLISAGAATAFVADGLLTAVLVNLLRTKHVGVKRMDQIVETLMLYGVNTGLLTGIINLLSLLFSLLYPNNLIYASFGMVATKLYANSLLAALNTRSSLRYTASSNESSTAGSGTPESSRRQVTAFEMHGHVASTRKVEIVENNQAFLTFELVGIAV